MTTPTDYKALCAELLQELCCHYRSWELKEGHCSDAMNRAPAALAEPPGEGPSDEDLDAIERQCWIPTEVCNDAGCEYLPDHRRFARAVLARWGHPATPPAPEPGEVGAAVARLMYWNGKVGNFDATSPVARTYTELPQGEALYLDEGEPLYLCNQGNTKRQSAQEPVPAPEPGEQHVSQSYKLPEPGEVGELVARLRSLRSLDCARAATLLEQQAAPAPVVVPVPVAERLPGEGDCDPQEKVWAWNPVLDHWKLSRINRSVHTHWLPAHAIPLPQAGEVQP